MKHTVIATPMAVPEGMGWVALGNQFGVKNLNGKFCCKITLTSGRVKLSAMLRANSAIILKSILQLKISQQIIFKDLNI